MLGEGKHGHLIEQTLLAGVDLAGIVAGPDYVSDPSGATLLSTTDPNPNDTTTDTLNLDYVEVITS